MPKPLLSPHFDSLATQERAARVGMWAFLASEALLFSGFFALYGAYRVMYGSDFVQGVEHNALWLGSLNTVVLITSSLTVALSIHATRAGQVRRALLLVLSTIALGAAFLVIKSIEYGQHFHHGIYPGRYYTFEELPAFGAKIFFTLYYLMTGTHALHVIIGLGVLSWCAVRLRARRFTAEHHVGLELSGLYWHLVDVVWVFLWPLLYLAR